MSVRVRIAPIASGSMPSEARYRTRTRRSELPRIDHRVLDPLAAVFLRLDPHR